MLLSTHPVVRGIIYGVAVAATIASIVLGELLPGESITSAVVKTADYLAGLAGATALSHLSVNKPALPSLDK